MTLSDPLKLNVWTLDDAVSVQQINQNFQKLEQAGGRLKLREITTTLAAYQVDIDVTDIDWNKWQRVILKCNLKGTGVVDVTIHNDTDGQYYHELGDLNKTDYRLGRIDRSNDSCRGKGVIIFEPYRDATFYVQCQTLTYYQTYYGHCYRHTYGQMNVVNLAVSDKTVAGNQIAVGSKIEIWGEY